MLESSQLLGEEDQVPETQPISPRQARLKPTPEPPYYKFHSDNPRGRRPNDFFAYWNSIGPEFRERLTVYIYRNWPVIAIMVPDRKRGGLKPTCQIAKIPGEDAIRDEDHLMRRFGSGDYTIRLNDATVRKSIALCVIKGLRGGEDHPPVIENYDQLVTDDPANQSFIEGLRQKGAMLGETEMAGSEAMSILAGTVKDLSAQNAAQAAAQAKKEPAPQQTPAEVTIATLEMAGKAFDQGVALTEKTMAAQTEAKVATAKAEAAVTAAQLVPAPNTGPTDALDMLTKVVGIVSTLAAGGQKAEASQPVLDKVTALAERFMARESVLEGRITSLIDARIQSLETQLKNPQPEHAQVPKDDPIANLEKLLNMKDKFQNLFGGGEGDEKAEKVPAWMSIVQSLSTGLPAAATALLAMSYNMAIARTGSGTPIPPVPVTENPSLPPAPDTSRTTTGENAMGNAVANFLSQIERPLINHLNDSSKTGADFADWVSSGYGDIGYQAAKEMGKDTLLAVLASRPTIAAVIQQIPERTSQFIDEFLTADEGNEGDEEPTETGNVRTFVAPAEGAAQIVDLPPIVQAQEGAGKKRNAGV
jgi:hypothetical protein